MKIEEKVKGSLVNALKKNYNRANKAVERGLIDATRGMKRSIVKEVRDKYNFKVKSVNDQLKIVKKKKILSAWNGYELISKTKRQGFQVGSYKDLEQGAIKTSTFVKNIRFKTKERKINKKQRKEKGYKANATRVTVEVVKGKPTVILEGYAVIRTANNYKGVFARGVYENGKFIAGDFKKTKILKKSKYKKDNRKFTRIYTMSVGNAINESYKNNKEKIDNKAFEDMNKGIQRNLKGF